MAAPFKIMKNGKHWKNVDSFRRYLSSTAQLVKTHIFILETTTIVYVAVLGFLNIQFYNVTLHSDTTFRMQCFFLT